MAQFVVRNLEGSVKSRLQRQAKRHGRSMEEEVRDILRNALRDDDAPCNPGSDIARLFTDIGLESEIAELRGHPLRPPSFER